MSPHVVLVALGQVLVGWAMAFPPSAVGISRSVLRSFALHAIVLTASGTVGLASVVVGTMLGLQAAVPPEPTSCWQVMPANVCASHVADVLSNDSPALHAGQRLPGTAGR